MIRLWRHLAATRSPRNFATLATAHPPLPSSCAMSSISPLWTTQNCRSSCGRLSASRALFLSSAVAALSSACLNLSSVSASLPAASLIWRCASSSELLAWISPSVIRCCNTYVLSSAWLALWSAWVALCSAWVALCFICWALVSASSALLCAALTSALALFSASWALRLASLTAACNLLNSSPDSLALCSALLSLPSWLAVALLGVSVGVGHSLSIFSLSLSSGFPSWSSFNTLVTFHSPLVRST